MSAMEVIYAHPWWTTWFLWQFVVIAYVLANREVVTKRIETIIRKSEIRP